MSVHLITSICPKCFSAMIEKGTYCRIKSDLVDFIVQKTTGHFCSKLAQVVFCEVPSSVIIECLLLKAACDEAMYFFAATSVITGLDLVQQLLSSAKCSENINPPTSHTVISPNTISWEGQDLSLISSSHPHYKSTGQNHRDHFIYHWFKMIFIVFNFDRL